MSRQSNKPPLIPHLVLSASPIRANLILRQHRKEMRNCVTVSELTTSGDLYLRGVSAKEPHSMARQWASSAIWAESFLGVIFVQTLTWLSASHLPQLAEICQLKESWRELKISFHIIPHTVHNALKWYKGDLLYQWDLLVYLCSIHMHFFCPLFVSKHHMKPGELASQLTGFASYVGQQLWYRQLVRMLLSHSCVSSGL